MSAEFDVVIRGGRVVDGTGAAPVTADVGVRDGVIAALGKFEGQGREEIDARGCVVTPGFVDIHTHYDGQVTWANRLEPSSQHGVTTVVMGNCGVGFAPCRPQDRADLIRLMEGVEDIPGVVMAEGLPWTWETFPDYLNFLDGRSYDMDIAAQLPHAPLRVYVMGQRGLEREPASAADIAKMSELAEEAIAAGALGFSTSRSVFHRASDFSLSPSVTAAEGELMGIALGVREGGEAVLQATCDFDYPEEDFALLRRVVDRSGLPLTFTLVQMHAAPNRWQTLLGYIEQATSEGANIKGQVFSRPIGVLLGMKLKLNPFSFCESYQPLAGLAIDDRVAAMRDPDLRARLIKEFPGQTRLPVAGTLKDFNNIFVMQDHPVYEPDRSDSIGARATSRGIDPRELAYDLLLENGGDTILYVPATNYFEGKIDAVEQMIRHKDTVLGVGDGGAHVGMICDASSTTYVLKRWVDKSANAGADADPLSLQMLVKNLTADAADTVGLKDRGRLGLGYRADINVINLDKLELYRPSVMYDLPAGSGRLDQRADGYVATLVNGELTYRGGKSTGNLPGRLVRGAQAAPQ